MTEYKVGSNLERDTLLIFRCLGVLNVSFDCHVGAGVFYNVLKKFGHKVEVVRGYYSSPHLRNGKRIQHSWVENIIEPYGLSKIIETVPEQMFPELSPEEQASNTIVLPDDEKRNRYDSMLESIMKEVLRKSNVCIDEKRTQHLSNLVELCVDRTLEKISKKRQSEG